MRFIGGEFTIFFFFGWFLWPKVWLIWLGRSGLFNNFFFLHFVLKSWGFVLLYMRFFNLFFFSLLLCINIFFFSLSFFFVVVFLHIWFCEILMDFELFHVLLRIYFHLCTSRLILHFGPRLKFVFWREFCERKI